MEYFPIDDDNILGFFITFESFLNKLSVVYCCSKLKVISVLEPWYYCNKFDVANFGCYFNNSEFDKLVELLEMVSIDCK